MNAQTWRIKSAIKSDNIQSCKAELFEPQFVSDTLGDENVKCRTCVQNNCTKIILDAMSNDCSHF